MSITLTQLRSFLAVVHTGSVTAAAEELVVTQPSVSAAVTALSKELGVELTERVGRSVQPSAAGRAFAPYAADVIGLLEQGERAASEVADVAARELRIAAVTTAAESLVPPLMQAFGARHPEIGLTLDVGNREEVFRAVLDHHADIAIGGRPPADGRLVGVPFNDNKIVLITAPEDPLARRRSVTVDELAERRWLLREAGSGTRDLNEQFLGGHELSPKALTLGSNGAIKQAARAGLGISLISHFAVDLELAAGLLATIPLRAELPPRRWYALRASAGPVRDPVARFMAFAASPEASEAVEAAHLSTGDESGLPSIRLEDGPRSSRREQRPRPSAGRPRRRSRT